MQKRGQVVNLGVRGQGGQLLDVIGWVWKWLVSTTTLASLLHFAMFTKQCWITRLAPWFGEPMKTIPCPCTLSAIFTKLAVRTNVFSIAVYASLLPLPMKTE